MYKLDQEKMFYDTADNQAIIIDAATGIYYALNPLGSLVFDCFVKGHTPAQVCAVLAALPGCPADKEARVAAFAESILAYGILEEDGESFQDAPVIDPGVAGDFTLVIDRFEDAVDLMMADPIHDVDLEMGWPVLKKDE